MIEFFAQRNVTLPDQPEREKESEREREREREAAVAIEIEYKKKNPTISMVTAMVVLNNVIPS